MVAGVMVSITIIVGVLLIVPMLYVEIVAMTVVCVLLGVTTVVQQWLREVMLPAVRLNVLPNGIRMMLCVQTPLDAIQTSRMQSLLTDVPAEIR